MQIKHTYKTNTEDSINTKVKVEKSVKKLEENSELIS